MRHLPYIFVHNTTGLIDAYSDPFQGTRERFQMLLENRNLHSKIDPILLKLSELVVSYETDTATQPDFQQLVMIRWYASQLKYHALIEQIDAYCQPYLMSSLDSRDPHALFMIANWNRDWGRVDMMKMMDYRPYFSRLLAALKKVRLKSRHEISSQITTLKKSLAVLQRRYATDHVNFNTLAAIDISVSISCLLDDVLMQMKLLDVRHHDACWLFIQCLSQLRSAAQVYYKLPQQRRSQHRQAILKRKDSLNAIKDSKALVSKLTSSKTLRQVFWLLEKLYKLERLFNWSDQVDNVAWFGAIMQAVGSAYYHATTMLNELIDENPKPTEKQLKLMQVIVHARQVLLTERFKHFYDPHLEVPCITAALAQHERESMEWQRVYLNNITSLIQQVGGVYPGLKIHLLGGTEPIVFQVQCRGISNKGMILRLSKMGIAPENQAAIDYLIEHQPKFLGAVYHQFGEIGELVQCGSCAEFFPNGTLQDYIIQLHKERINNGFMLVQQKAMFAHFSQLLKLLHHLHDANIIFPDIKPTNFLFSSDPSKRKITRLLLSDLKSLMQLPPGESQTAQVFYTPGYKAPEIKIEKSGLLSEKVDPKPHDFYALGVTLHEYLTGTACLTVTQKPRNQFEQVMGELVRGLTQADPVRRLNFAHTVYENLGAWRARAITNRMSYYAGQAALFGQTVSGRVVTWLVHGPETNKDVTPQ